MCCYSTRSCYADNGSHANSVSGSAICSFYAGSGSHADNVFDAAISSCYAGSGSHADNGYCAAEISCYECIGFRVDSGSCASCTRAYGLGLQCRPNQTMYEIKMHEFTSSDHPPQ